MSHSIKRVALVEHGTSALHALRALREYNNEQGTHIQTVALVTESNHNSLFAQEADEAVFLGSDTWLDGAVISSRYADVSALEDALAAARVDAVWCGWGWMAGRSELAEICERLGMAYLGNSAELLKQTWDSTQVMKWCESAGIVVNGTEAGNPGQTRLLEIPTLTDTAGNTWVFGVTDTTLSFNEVSTLYESPSPVLAPEDEQRICAAAKRLVQAAGLNNLVDIRVEWDNQQKAFRHVEVHPGSSIAHAPVSARFGCDLLKLSFLVAFGGLLEGPEPVPLGAAMAVGLRVIPETGEIPAPERLVECLQIPSGHGLALDAGYVVGDGIGHCDGMTNLVGVLTTTGRNRTESLSRLQCALMETTVAVKGYTTNKTDLLKLLHHPEVAAGKIPGDLSLDLLGTDTVAAVALLQTAIELQQADLAVEIGQFGTSAARGRPQVKREAGHTYEVSLKGQTYVLSVFQLSPANFRILVDGQTVAVTAMWLNKFERRLSVGGKRYRTMVAASEPHFVVEVEGALYRIFREDLGAVRSPTPAVVVSIPVTEGQMVKHGDLVAVLETMKLEMQVYAPYTAKVRKVLVLPNVQVDTGAPLIQLELTDQQKAAIPPSEQHLSPKVLFPAMAETPEAECAALFEVLRSVLLGYDVDAFMFKDLLGRRAKLCSRLAPNDPELLAHENELLSIFVDVCSLFQRQSFSDDNEMGEILSPQEFFLTYLRTFDVVSSELPASFVDTLQANLARYEVRNLRRTPKLEAALLRLYKSFLYLQRHVPLISSILERRLASVEQLHGEFGPDFNHLLTRMVAETRLQFPSLSELAREVRFRFFDEQLFRSTKEELLLRVELTLADLELHPNAEYREERIHELTNCPLPLAGKLSERFRDASLAMKQIILEVLTRRYYRIRDLEHLDNVLGKRNLFVTARYTHPHDGVGIWVASTLVDYEHLEEAGREMCSIMAGFPENHDIMADFYLWKTEKTQTPDEMEAEIRGVLNQIHFPRPLRRIAVSVALPGTSGNEGARHFTYRHGPEGYQEEKIYRSLHPMMGKRLHLWRMENFNTERLPSAEDIYVFHATAKENPKDERVVAVAEVRDLTILRYGTGKLIQIPYLEHMVIESASHIRKYLATRTPAERPQWNRLFLYVWPFLNLTVEEINQLARDYSAATAGLGLEWISIRCEMRDPFSGIIKDMVIVIENPGGFEPVVSFQPPADKPLEPLTDYKRKVVQTHRRGMVYPYEIIEMLTGSLERKTQFPPGEFTEFDLDENNQLIPVSRPYGQNKANIIVGLISNSTPKYKEGMKRVIVLGDPSKSVGALAEAECRRICKAIEMAAALNLPLEWFALSAGAKISMESGTENMDWIAVVLKDLIHFTQTGGEVNIIVNGINVGAQPYWNAEATMLMHTRGILIMTPNGAMVLTGKRALDFSGSVSAEDNFGIGGYERVMGPNGQAQYWATDIVDACRILLHHYDLTYVMPRERFPRRCSTTDSFNRNICDYPYNGSKQDGFEKVGEIFTAEKNADRKRAFDIRSVMKAVVDQDHAPLERWAGMRDSEIPVIWDAHIGGYPVCLIGIESKPLPRLGFVSADGPQHWTAGTLFPFGSKKVARSVNAASGNRPLVVLANLSGFDGSPESMRKCQLEFGAEIGRAVVNFDGPIIFCVVSRYHGGAYVVFSSKLNDNIEAVALEGSYASVIGGAPAAAVVFAGDVEKRTKSDPRVVAAEAAIAQADNADKPRLRAEYGDTYNLVYSEKLGQVAQEFDTIHSVQRAMQVGSLHRIIPSNTLRPYLVDAIERGIARTLGALPDMNATM
ncbi:MAG: biotin/lipoyl-binding protein [Blastocatellia bacterium]|nr:biotin/lipoyl-binding protein [Blastocatellia bacterium]